MCKLNRTSNWFCLQRDYSLYYSRLELHLFTMPLEYDVTQMLRYPAPQSIAGVKPEDFYTIPINMR